MPEAEATSVALERRPVQIPAQLISDDEIRRLYRIAESLALSRMFKDVERAEQAFAKMIIGRDLGMSPAQAMLGLHIVEGSVMVHYAMLGRFVKARADEGYGYRSGWLKQDEAAVVDGTAQPPTMSFVWMDEDDPSDQRPVVGASVAFSVDGQTVGVSTFTFEDARRAGLIKDNAKAAWNTSRRNMLLARAMSNGVKWFVPEVMGGLPIYVEGEVVEDRSVTAPVGDGDDSGQGLDLGPKVEGIIERAVSVGHAGLSNRAALEIALGNRAPAVVNQWLIDAKKELDRFEAERTTDAVVVDDRPLADEPKLAHQAQEDRVVQDMETQVLQARLRQLEEARADEQDPEQRALIDEEVEHVRHRLGEDEESVGA